jgi:hypothetical protein
VLDIELALDLTPTIGLIDSPAQRARHHIGV